jgi:hypothetical protein
MATRQRKSMSTEATFRDTSDKDALIDTVDSLCDQEPILRIHFSAGNFFAQILSSDLERIKLSEKQLIVFPAVVDTNLGLLDTYLLSSRTLLFTSLNVATKQGFLRKLRPKLIHKMDSSCPTTSCPRA